MRILLSLAFLIAGVAALVYAVDRAFDEAASVPIGMVGLGLVATVIGIAMMRVMSSGRSEAPIPPPESLGDHSLVDEPVSGEPSSIPTASVPRSEGQGSSSRLVVVIAAALLVLGAGAVALFVAAEVETVEVAVQIQDACVEARRAADGPAASFGKIVSQETLSTGEQFIVYETSQEWTWSCTWDPASQTATVSAVFRP